jgi:DNA-directed RNA polymerase specialized sigma24 family protein
MNGGPAEFEEFYRSDYKQLLSMLIVAAGGRLHDAQEALDGAMLEALEKWDTVRSPRGFVRIAAIHRLIKEKKRIHKELNPLDEDSVKPGHIPEQEAWEQEQWVKELLRSLTPAQRKVLAYIFDGFRAAEIALLLGSNPAAVRRNLCDARGRLRNYLAETNGAEITATAHGEEAR